MTDDIITRLREEIDSLKVDVQVLRDAVDEIERLEQYVEELRSDRYEWVKEAQGQKAEIEQLRTPNFDTWLNIGLTNGWITPPGCLTHDGIPYTDDEMALPEHEMWDICVFGARINTPKM